MYLTLLALHLASPPALAAEDVCYESTNDDGEIIVVTESLVSSCAAELADGRLIQISVSEDVDTCEITGMDADGVLNIACPPGNNDVIVWPT